MSRKTTEEETTLYNVFHRTWWKDNPAWPRGLEPQPGERHEIAEGVTWAEARQLCDEYNASHDEGRLSDKAEFERA